jgi:hypothetical protein
MNCDRVDLSASAVRSRPAWGLGQFLVLALENNEFNPDVHLEDTSLIRFFPTVQNLSRMVVGANTSHRHLLSGKKKLKLTVIFCL